MDRPIVVNSLLCFIHNYRHSLLPDQLRTLLDNYFPKSARLMAHATLNDLLSAIPISRTPVNDSILDMTNRNEHIEESCSNKSNNDDNDKSDDNNSDLLCLYDRVCTSDQTPIFAAADLNILPLQLITDEDDSKTELLREIRQLKQFIQNALNGRVDDSSTTLTDCGVQTTNEEQLDHILRSQTSCCLGISPKSSFKSPANLFISSPELSPSTSSIMSTPTPCLSLIPNALPPPLSSYHQSIFGSTNSYLGATFTPNDVNLNNKNSNQNGGFGMSPNCNRRKRDGCGNRLDAMIRKLADRQKEKEAAAMTTVSTVTLTNRPVGTCIGSGSSATTNLSLLSSSLSSNSSFSSSSSLPLSSATAVVPSERSSPPAKAMWHAQMIDPIAYVSMLRTMSGAAAVATAISTSSSVLPSVNKMAQNDHRLKTEPLIEFGENLEDGSMEVPEKNSSESSPSPSNSLNNIDETTSYTSSDLAEKPFTCEHVNCHKRFANKFLLKKHQFIHTGLRPHCCPFCGKRFNRKDNLLRHKKTHIANALGTDITSALSSDDFLLQLAADRTTIKLENEPEEENEN